MRLATEPDALKVNALSLPLAHALAIAVRDFEMTPVAEAASPVKEPAVADPVTAISALPAKFTLPVNDAKVTVVSTSFGECPVVFQWVVVVRFVGAVPTSVEQSLLVVVAVPVALPFEIVAPSPVPVQPLRFIFTVMVSLVAVPPFANGGLNKILPTAVQLTVPVPVMGVLGGGVAPTGDAKANPPRTSASAAAYAVRRRNVMGSPLGCVHDRRGNSPAHVV